jgi:hypothetical protein
MNWSNQVSCYDRRSIGQSSPEKKNTHLGPTTRLPPLSESREPPDEGYSPPDERKGPPPHNSCRPSPAQSLSGTSHAGPATTLHLRGFPFRLLPRPAGPRWRHATPPLHEISDIYYFFKSLGPECDIITCVSLFVFDHNEHNRLVISVLHWS